MIKLFKIPLLTFTLLGSAYAAFGMTMRDTTKEDTPLKDTVKEKSYFKIGVDYISNNVFMGRTSTVATPTIEPEAKFTFKSGLYVSGSLDYLPNNKTQKLDGGDIGAGYDFDITDDLTGGVSYTKLFSSENSTRIGSSISSTFNAFFDYDIGDIITPSIGGDYDINKQGISNDAFFNLGLSHDFIARKIFGSKDLLLISPTVSANAGTQNFYDGYLTKKVFKNAKRTANQNTLITKFEQNASQFKILDYELSAPFEYKAGYFILQFTPTYAIVQNEFKPAAAKALGLADKSSVFYFTIGAVLKF
jgi:hypothetical protein